MSENTYQNAIYLATAIKESNIGLTEELINQGVDVNYKGPWGETALHNASESGNFEIVKLLVDNGADVNAERRVHRDKDDKYYPLTIAISKGYISIAEFLVNQGANVNSYDEFHTTPLHFLSNSTHWKYKMPKTDKTGLALACKKEEVFFKLLIKKGVHICTKNDLGDTPLSKAIGMANLHIAKLLIEHGIDINVRGRHGQTPVFDAHSIEAYQFCIDNGADLNIHDTYTATTPLHTAVSFRNPKVIELLVKNGAHINSIQEDGRTPLQQAIYFGCKLDNIQALLDMGADADVTNNSYPKETALDMALSNWESGQNHAAVLLLKDHTTIKPQYPPKGWA